ncbi:MAG TPA: hypothetical protein VGM03_15140, partial [Phycisphaerae bacterium]
LVIYGPEGELIRHFRLEDLIDARAATEARERGAPVRWGRNTKFAFSRDERYLIVRPVETEIFLVELSTGNLLRRGEIGLARAPELESLLEEATAAGDDLFASTEPMPLADPDEPFDFLSWLNDQFRGTDDDNSAPLLEAAAASLTEGTDMLSAAISAASNEWDLESAAAVSEWLDANAGALDLFRQAAHKSALRYDLQSEDGSMINATVLGMNLAPVRTLARGLVADASRALSEGHIEAAADDYRDVLAVGRQLLQRPTLIEYLAGVATTGIAYQGLLRVPLRAPDGAVDYAALRARFAAAELEIPSAAPLVEMERLMFHDTLQRLYTTDPVSGRSAPDSERIETLAGQLGCDKQDLGAAIERMPFEEILAKADEYYDAWAEALRRDFPSARQRFDDLNRLAESEPNLLVRKLQPVFGRIYQLQAAAQARRRAALLTMALHEHRQRKRSFPASLSELNVSGLDARTAIDPFTEQPFRYEPNGDSFRLWTPGVDGLEHGGKTVPLSQEGGDSVLFPPP